jgi:hypothetical protein
MLRYLGAIVQSCNRVIASRPGNGMPVPAGNPLVILVKAYRLALSPYVFRWNAQWNPTAPSWDVHGNLSRGAGHVPRGRAIT